MAGFRASETIDLAPEQLFAFATDVQSSTAWVKGCVRVEPLTEGPMRPGWKYLETRRRGKREASYPIEIHRFEGPAPGREPPYRYALGGAAMGLAASYDFSFHPDGPGRTRVDLHAEVRGTNPFAQLLAGFAAKGMEREDRDVLQRLKRAAETGAGP